MPVPTLPSAISIRQRSRRLTSLVLACLAGLAASSAGAAGRWTIQELVRARPVDGRTLTRVALTPAGDAIVAHAGLGVTVAWRQGAGWRLDDDDDAGCSTLDDDDLSMAVDFRGWPTVCYHLPLDGLRCARFDGSGWSVDTVDGDGRDASVAIDPAGFPAVSYHTGTNLVRLARFDGSGWNREAVPLSGANAVAFDPAGQPAIVAIGGSLGVRLARYGGTTWQVETASAEAGTLSHPDLAFDPAGEPAVSYYNFTGTRLRLARHGAGAWQVEDVDTLAPPLSSPALVFNPSGQALLAYDGRLARRDPSGWTFETVPGASAGTDLCLDALGHPLVSSRFATPSSIPLVNLARHDGTAWSVEEVDRGEPAFPYALTLDATGNPTVAYTVGSELRAARYTAGGWTFEPIDPGPAGEASAASDAAGHPSIAYRFRPAAGGQHIRLARHDGTAWTVEDTPASDDEYSPALALDPTGRPRIACATSPAKDLLFLSKDASTWTTATVDDVGETGEAPSLTLSGGPLITYRRRDDATLLSAQWDGTTWIKTTVDAGGAGFFSSLARAASGSAAVAYLDAAGALRCARDDGSGWVPETVAAGSGAPSLALDAAGEPEIAAVIGQKLVLASRGGTGWSLEEVDGAGKPYSPHLAFTAGGLPVIAYSSLDCRSLLVASPTCGNGTVDPGEACDGAGMSPTCDADCTAAVCGDGFVNPLAGEACDDANSLEGDGCRPDCTREVCGDSILDPGESCDDGNTVDGDSCPGNCRLRPCCLGGVCADLDLAACVAAGGRPGYCGVGASCGAPSCDPAAIGPIRGLQAVKSNRGRDVHLVWTSDPGADLYLPGFVDDKADIVRAGARQPLPGDSPCWVAEAFHRGVGLPGLPPGLHFYGVDGGCSSAIPPGACCTGLATCVEGVLDVTCTAAGGSAGGPGSTCAGACIPRGACCRPGTCLDARTAGECHGLTGTYLGDASTCAADGARCADGSCCTPTGCFVTASPVTCGSAGGSFAGAGTSCCGSCTLDGACCLPSGCMDGYRPGDCSAIGGQHAGACTTCADVPSPCP